MTSATISGWISAYWNGLQSKLDAIDPLLYSDLVADAAVHIQDFDISNLTVPEKVRVQALLICIEAGGMPSLAGWSQERHYDTLKIDKRTWSKKGIMDQFLGELKYLLPDWTDSSMAAIRSAQFPLTKTDSIYLAPKLDHRSEETFRDRDPVDIKNDYISNSYPNEGPYPPSQGRRIPYPDQEN